MHITKLQLDDLNAIITISIAKDDYKNQVEACLQTQKKNAQLRGFRKGKVPMGLIRKQYEKALTAEQIQRLLQQNLHQYIVQENLNILGEVLPREQEAINFDAEELSFEFELGLSPQFDLDIDVLDLIHYQITVSDEEVDKYIKGLRERHGKLESKESVGQNDRIYGKIEALPVKREVREIWHKHHTFSVEKLSKEARSKCLEAKVGTTIEINTAELFPEAEEWNAVIGEENASHFPVQWTLERIFYIQPADLNQEFFDKAYGKGTVKSEEEFRAKIKVEYSEMYAVEADAILFDRAISQLVEKTKFDLPTTFLQRWMQQRRNISDEQVLKEYEKREKGFRYQLIENKLGQKFNVQIGQEEIRQKARSVLQSQLARYGQETLDEALLEQFVERTLQREEEIRRISTQVFRDRVLTILKEQLRIKNQTCSWTEFLQELGRENLDSSKDL